MTLRLYYHPLSSFCWKALIALYEKGVAFEPQLVDFSDPAQDAAFRKMWPIRKFPVLRDEAEDRLVPESSIIIEYIDQKFPGGTRLIPADPAQAREMRFRDRFFDLYVHIPMQKVIGDRLRPDDKRDPFGVEQAKEQIETSYRMLDQQVDARRWVMGDDFSMADCAALPALFYGNMVVPFGEHRNVTAYFERLKRRPSIARVIGEAEPYFKYVPQ
ncbi:MAG TPA: glutathione S-transferase family protein [Dongiaceae bacterium]|jgi:glutathione S-transferase|nr:glutathione S-transferase family protein [Dongiaceae bacterium]